MKAQLLNWISVALSALAINRRWMTWNLFLAFIPVALSIWLFRLSRQRSILWWLGLLVFFAFLPNAPYVLTDILHLVYDIREGYSIWIITLVLVPLYLFFILGGFQAYVMSLINLGYYLHKQGKSHYILAVELITHALSAIGIYLGRFQRFNSWDLITQPDALADSIIDDLASKGPVLIIAITFVIVAALYWLMKQLSLGFLLRMRQKFSDRPLYDQRSEDTSARL
jgi:uncharacterized membrane protein